jgi:hypothetical protein
MLIIIVIFLSILSVISIIAAYKFYKIADFHMDRADLYENWIKEFRNDVRKTYIDIKTLDSKQIFEKDDEVGQTFSQLLEIIDKLNNVVQEEEEEEKIG